MQCNAESVESREKSDIWNLLNTIDSYNSHFVWTTRYSLRDSEPIRFLETPRSLSESIIIFSIP